MISEASASLQTQQTPADMHPELGSAHAYVETVRGLYRDGEASYSGRRNGDQQIIAELAGEEARIIVDGAANLVSILTRTELPENYQDVNYAGIKWSEFSGEFERLLVGFGVITNRIHRDHPNVADYLELEEPERLKAASVLFGDFLAHNALRFGVDGSGIRQSAFGRSTEDGKVVRVVRDKDVVRSERELRENIVTRKYSSGVSTHAAGKMSPADYVRLRREFPEVDKDQFDVAAGGYRSFEEYLEGLGE